MDRLTVMQIFVRVVETGSFSAAAKILNIGQPSVSKSIVQLEERIGVRLIMRSTHGSSPTEAGRKFYERALRVIEEANEAERLAISDDSKLSGNLRVGAGISFGKLHVIPLLPNFLAAHPNLSVDLILDDRPIDFIGEGIDLGLRFGPLPDSSLIARKVTSRPRVVLGTPSYFERAGTPRVPSDLITHAAIMYTQDRGGCDAWTFRRGVETQSVNLSGRLRVSASEGLRAAVLGGMGLAIASSWTFASEFATGAVSIVLRDWKLPDCELWAVFPTGRMASAKARAFTEFVEGELGASFPNEMAQMEPAHLTALDTAV